MKCFWRQERTDRETAELLRDIHAAALRMNATLTGMARVQKEQTRLMEDMARIRYQVKLRDAVLSAGDTLQRLCAYLEGKPAHGGEKARDRRAGDILQEGIDNIMHYAGPSAPRPAPGGGEER